MQLAARRMHFWLGVGSWTKIKFRAGHGPVRDLSAHTSEYLAFVMHNNLMNVTIVKLTASIEMPLSVSAENWKHKQIGECMCGQALISAFIQRECN